MNRAFGIAILVSALWHLVVASTFTVVIFPTKFTPGEFSDITFLGPILLEEGVFGVRAKKKPIFTRVQHERTLEFLEGLSAELTPPLRESPAEMFDIYKRPSPRVEMKGFFRASKKVPQAFYEESFEEYTPTVSGIEGPASEREVLFKPELPELIRWPTKLESDLDMDVFEMEVKFIVSPDGRVRSVEKLRSCGYPEIDLLGVRYAKMWRFAPLTLPRKMEEEWGRLKLRFRLQW